MRPKVLHDNKEVASDTYTYNQKEKLIVLTPHNSSSNGVWSIQVNNGHASATANFTLNITGTQIAFFENNEDFWYRQICLF